MMRSRALTAENRNSAERAVDRRSGRAQLQHRAQAPCRRGGRLIARSVGTRQKAIAVQASAVNRAIGHAKPMVARVAETRAGTADQAFATIPPHARRHRAAHDAAAMSSEMPKPRHPALSTGSCRSEHWLQERAGAGALHAAGSARTRAR